MSAQPRVSLAARVVGGVAGLAVWGWLSVPSRKRRVTRQLQAMRSAQDPAVRVREARTALALLEAIPETSSWRLATQEYHLPELAEAAIEAGEKGKALAYARRMQKVARHAYAWYVPQLVHHRHITLGRVALAEGKVKRAEHHLLAAGALAGVPEPGFVTPGFGLANELLARGRTEVVLEYLRLCQRFWEQGCDQLAHWTAEIRAGRRPWLDAMAACPLPGRRSGEA